MELFHNIFMLCQHYGDWQGRGRQTSHWSSELSHILCQDMFCSISCKCRKVFHIYIYIYIYIYFFFFFYIKPA